MRSGGSGTKTRSATTVLLPVPFMPATNHVSSIVSSLIGMITEPMSIGTPSGPSWTTPPSAHVACRLPDAHAHRPDTM